MKQDNVFDPEDPRLSAYALGELEGEELAAMERLVAVDPRAAAFVDELRSTAGIVGREFAMEVSTASGSARDRSTPAIQRKVGPSRPRMLAHAAGLVALLGASVFVVSRSLKSEHGSASPTPAPADENVAVLTAQVEPNPEQFKTPAPPMAALPAMREAKENAGVETAVGYGMPTAGPGQAGASGPTSFSSRSLGGGGRRSSAAGKVAAAKPAVGILYDNGESGDFRKVAVDSVDALKDGANTEAYNSIVENAFKLAAQDPLSTFSIDVDTASYANVRRFLNGGQLPPADAVRVEELINYFRYAYPAPEGNAPFSTSATVASCPWAPTHKLVQVRLRARDVDLSKRQPSNLVFLIDVSGSMDSPDKLPLLKRSMRMLVEQLDGRDRIAMVVYAGASGLALPSTSCAAKAVIDNALDALSPGGSTNGAAGIELAYQIAAENRISEGQNRVILCTDGDFNVGTTDQGSLVRLIEEKRKSGVFLSVLGFGTGNVKDSTMEMLADKGNGNYAYIDSLAEARKVLVSEMGGTLFTVAKDVKIQVEFNPTRVQAWRLIGYENRQLAHQDFNDDKKDAGEIGAGHNVTAFYEVVPVGVRVDVPGVDPLRYQQPTMTTSAAYTGELLTLKLRYKAPDGDTSQLISTPVADGNAAWSEAGSDFRFAAAVAGFGLVLRKSGNVGAFTLQDVLSLALPEVGDDVAGYRREFVELVRKAQAIEGKPTVR